MDGSERGTALSASRITQAHQLVGAVLKYAQRTGKIAKNVALEIKRSEDLPQQTERERRYLSHAELLGLARATDRFETLTLSSATADCDLARLRHCDGSTCASGS